MSKEKRRVPKLRFPGFTEDWEQCKLNEFLSVSNLKNTEDKYNKKDVLSVSGDYGIVNQIEFQGRSFAGVSVSNYGVVETGDIVYTKSPLKLNPYGIIKTNRINNGIVSTLYAIYKTKENCDSKFIEHYFNLDSRLNKYLKPLVNKGAKNDMKVSSENALIGEVCFPHITEQKLIADFLDWLDVYITLHQRKLEHLNLKKKALLQKLFPKDGERYPELRFPGFTDAWEQRKLGEFTNQINTFVNPEDAKLPLWSLTAEAGLIEKTDRYERDFLVKKKDQFKRIENNTLVYNPMNITIGSIDIYTGLYPIAVSGYYVSIVYDKNIDTDFLKEVLLLPSSLKMYKNYATGSLIERQRVQYPTFSKLQLLFPNPDEQRAIGQLFKSLNLNITLHQRKLEDLQLQKKALLQQMFV